MIPVAPAFLGRVLVCAAGEEGAAGNVRDGRTIPAGWNLICLSSSNLPLVPDCSRLGCPLFRPCTESSQRGGSEWIEKKEKGLLREDTTRREFLLSIG